MNSIKNCSLFRIFRHNNLKHLFFIGDRKAKRSTNPICGPDIYGTVSTSCSVYTHVWVFDLTPWLWRYTELIHWVERRDNVPKSNDLVLLTTCLRKILDYYGYRSSPLPYWQELTRAIASSNVSTPTQHSTGPNTSSSYAGIPGLVSPARIVGPKKFPSS